jgi:hypothetical protein
MFHVNPKNIRKVLSFLFPSLPDLIGLRLMKAIQKKEPDYPFMFTRLRRRQRRPGPDNDNHWNRGRYEQIGLAQKSAA